MSANCAFPPRDYSFTNLLVCDKLTGKRITASDLIATRGTIGSLDVDNLTVFDSLNLSQTVIDQIINQIDQDLPAAIIFKYAPAFIGTLPAGTYTDWATLMTNLLDSTSPLKIVMFSEEGVANSVVIPAGGPYDMTGIVWYSTQGVVLPAISGGIIPVYVSEGATFRNLAHIDGLIRIRYQGTTQPAMISDGGLSANQSPVNLKLENGAGIIIDGTQPFIRVDPTGGVQVFLGDQTGLTPNAGPVGVLHINGAAAVALGVFGGQTSVPADSVTATGIGSTLILNFYTKAGNNVPLNTASYSGLGTVTVLDSTRVASQVRSIVAPAAGNDASTGVFVGTTWLNTAVGPTNTYICRDNTVGAAVWDPLN